MKIGNLERLYVLGLDEGARTPLEATVWRALREAKHDPAKGNRLRELMWRLGGWRNHVETAPPNALEDEAALRRELGLDPPLPPVTPVDPLPDPDPVLADQLGDWQGHFLTSNHFFGPAIAARSPESWRDYFRYLAQQGHRSVLINAEQDDWGPRKGRPEWTAGGIRAHDRDEDLETVVDCLKMARRFGLVPVLGVMDQPSLHERSINDIVRLSSRLVEQTHPWVAMYWLSWEIREVWRDSTERERLEDRWIGDVDWHGRDVGIHYQAASKTLEDEDPGLGGGVNRYRALEDLYPHHVVRLLQYHNEAPRQVIQEQTRRTAGVVHANHGLGKFCAAEFASEANQPTTYTPEQVIRRRGWILDTLREIGLPADRQGYLN